MGDAKRQRQGAVRGQGGQAEGEVREGKPAPPGRRVRTRAARWRRSSLQDVAAYRAKGGSGKSDAGKKSGPGRPAAKKAVPVHDDDDDDDEEDEDDEEDDDEDDDE